MRGRGLRHTCAGRAKSGGGAVREGARGPRTPRASRRGGMPGPGAPPQSSSASFLESSFDVTTEPRGIRLLSRSVGVPCTYAFTMSCKSLCETSLRIKHEPTSLFPEISDHKNYMNLCLS